MTDARVSAAIIEVLGQSVADARASSLLIEVMGSASLPSAQVSGLIIEVMGTQVSTSVMSDLMIEVMGTAAPAPVGIQTVDRLSTVKVKADDGEWYPLKVVG